MKVVLIFSSALIMVLSLTGLITSAVNQSITTETLKKEAIQDSTEIFDLNKINNDVKSINLKLRNVIAKNPTLEKALVKDSSYINLSAKYN